MTSTNLHTAYIALGSNLDSRVGSPYETIHAAFHALSEIGEVTAQSSLYETAPVGLVQQPPFINAVAALQTSAAPEKLLEKMLALELSFGRDRQYGAPKGPRTLDLDLLLLDDLIVNTPTLTLPHPALAERRFVLAPLAEVAPELMHPALRRTIRDLLRDLPNTGTNSSDAVRIVTPHP